jgi:cytochrome b
MPAPAALFAASMDSTRKGARPAAGGRVRVWDLPTRLFHWSLVALVTFSIVTAKLGGLWLDWHMRSGYAILALLVFRLLWGVAGSRHARLVHFVRGPRIVLAYLRGRHPHDGAGHNPLGAVSVVAILGVLLAQAATGLFTNDGSFTEGPLAKLVGAATGERLSTVHRWGELAVYALIGVHLAAVLFYLAVKRDNLVGPMITGDRRGIDAHPARDDAALWLRAAVMLTLAAGLTSYVVLL